MGLLLLFGDLSAFVVDVKDASSALPGALPSHSLLPVGTYLSFVLCHAKLGKILTKR
jgi:hypothetical protein